MLKRQSAYARQKHGDSRVIMIQNIDSFLAESNAR